jgi:hypothetical protein
MGQLGKRALETPAPTSDPKLEKKSDKNKTPAFRCKYHPGKTNGKVLITRLLTPPMASANLAAVLFLLQSTRIEATLQWISYTHSADICSWRAGAAKSIPPHTSYTTSRRRSPSGGRI